MAEVRIAQSAPEPTTTRTARALRLYEERGREIERIGEDLYLVPSQDGERAYPVLYGEREECLCPDHQYRGATCVHILATGIYCAKRRIRPELVAGDPFAYAGDGDRHGCYSGVVYLGYDEDGHEWTEPVPCFRCSR